MTSDTFGILQLVKLSVSDINRNQKIEVTALVDTGPSVSYIDQQIKEMLSLKSLRTVNMSVCG